MGFKVYPSKEKKKTQGDRLCALSKAARNKHSIHLSFCSQVNEMEGFKVKRCGPGILHIPPLTIPESNEIIIGSFKPGYVFNYTSKFKIAGAIFGAGDFDGSEPIGLIRTIKADVSEVLEKVKIAASAI